MGRKKSDMKNKPFINAKILVGGIFAFVGALFAVIGILLYLFADPTNTTGSFDDPVKNHMMLCGIFTFMGLIFFFFGIVMLINEIRMMNKKKSLVETGRKIYAVITGVAEDTSITINGRHPYYAIAQYEDPYSGEKEFYNTRSYDTDLTHTIGATVSVYIDQSNPGLYYVDFDPESVAVKY